MILQEEDETNDDIVIDQEESPNSEQDGLPNLDVTLPETMEVSVKTNEEQGYACGRCDQIFERRQRRDIHIKNHKTKTLKYCKSCSFKSCTPNGKSEFHRESHRCI